MAEGQAPENRLRPPIRGLGATGQLRFPETASKQAGDHAQLKSKDKEGHDDFMKLAKKADVIVENTSDESMPKVDYKSGKKVEPEEIYGRRRLRPDRSRRGALPVSTRSPRACGGP